MHGLTPSGLFAPQGTYAELRPLVEHGDEPAIKALLGMRKQNTACDLRPQQYGGGRIEVEFPDGLRPISAPLHLATGLLEVILANDQNRQEEVFLRVSPLTEAAWLQADPALLAGSTIHCLPSWHFIQETLEKTGIAPPQEWSEPGKAGGFEQTLPEDDSLALAWNQRSDALVIATALGASPARQAGHLAESVDLAQLAQTADAWKWEMGSVKDF